MQQQNDPGGEQAALAADMGDGMGGGLQGLAAQAQGQPQPMSALPPPQDRNQPQGMNAIRPQPFPAPPRDPFGRPNPNNPNTVPYDPNVGERAPQAPPLTPPGIDLGADMPDMGPYQAPDRPNPMETGGPMNIPKPPMGPMGGGPFTGYDPNDPNTPPTTMPTPPQDVRPEDWETGGETEGAPRPPTDPFGNPLDDPYPTLPGGQYAPPKQPGINYDPFKNQSAMPQASMSQARPNSLQGLRAQAQGQPNRNEPQTDAYAQHPPELRETLDRFRARKEGYEKANAEARFRIGQSNRETQPQTSQIQRQYQGQDDTPTTAQQNKFIRDKHGAVGNQRLNDLRSKYGYQLGDADKRFVNQSAAADQQRLGEGNARTKAMKGSAARGRMQLAQYYQSRQPTEADKQFIMGQGNRRNPGSMDMSLLQKPQQTRQTSSSTTMNVRQPNKGMQQQQFTAGQNRALGNTMQTSSSNASAMRNAASRYKRAGLQSTANRAKPRTSLPQLYGN